MSSRMTTLTRRDKLSNLFSKILESQSLRLIKEIRSSLMILSLLDTRLLYLIKYSAILFEMNVLLHPDCPLIQAIGLEKKKVLEKCILILWLHFVP